SASCLPVLTEVKRVCGVDECGNGAIDTCQECSIAGTGMACFDRPEPCDGKNLGGASCEGNGFAGGEPGCTAWCGVDERRRESCEAIGGGLHACTRVCVDAVEPVAIALAATESVIGLAWLSEGDAEHHELVHFARFDQQFALLGES